MLLFAKFMSFIFEAAGYKDGKNSNSNLLKSGTLSFCTSYKAYLIFYLYRLAIYQSETYLTNYISIHPHPFLIIVILQSSRFDRSKAQAKVEEQTPIVIVAIYLSNSIHILFTLTGMAASFASRLSNLREKKITQNEQDNQLRLTLPPDSSQKSTYEPSSTFNNTRGSFRLLKGRIDRGQSSQKQQLISNNVMQDSKGMSTIQKISLQQQSKPALKLVLNDDNYVQEKKPMSQPPKIPIQKRILIAKQPPKQQIRKEEPPPKKEEPKKEEKQEPVQQKIQKKQQQKIIAHEEKPIREQELEESLPPESENDLVLCPEGCGRKFNRKALEKHAKACKLVFMSKRKEFNSEAKRITSKQQATLVKQTKLEEKKKMGMTKGKGFDKTKTGNNWKAASEDFREAVKAMKKEEKEEQQEQEEANIDDNLEDKKVINVTCEYCEKQFNEVFIEKHQENCVKKKEKERANEKKKTGKK